MKTEEGERVERPLVVGLRDRAVIAILIYTAARIGAVAGLKRGSLTHDGSQWTLRFAEKNGMKPFLPRPWQKHAFDGYSVP